MADQPQQPDDMSSYLQMFLDETEEQLDDLVESLLILENAPESPDELNEAFRLIHSIKGAAGMMGLESISVLTHHLENRFEQFRSGVGRLDQPTMDVVLRCIDFLRECNVRLRDGNRLGSPTELLDELRGLEDRDEPSSELSAAAEPSPPDPEETPAAATVAEAGQWKLAVTFEPDLELADLKARLILARLNDLGEIQQTRPTTEELESVETLSSFEVVLSSPHREPELREAADVDGVVTIEVTGEAAPATVESTSPADTQPEEVPVAADPAHVEAAAAATVASDSDSPDEAEAVSEVAAEEASAAQPLPEPVEEVHAGPQPVATKVAETMRVDIERLDHLMNLAGQLVINRARFVQLSEQLSPALKKTQELSRLREFINGLQRQFAELNGELPAQLQDWEAGLALLEQHFSTWEESRRSMKQVNEAIDQLTRVSDSLQRGVMQTRMVPVAPLFNRFNRTVRDLSLSSGKQVRLEVQGEKTELDKRMIDQLGDPMMHLVRNCVDHGLESPEVREAADKPAEGTVSLEASHSGNNIIIQVRDDGGGIDVGKLRNKIIERGLLSAAAVDGLDEEQIIDFIWHPGLSTASEITDVSGRGVGMDVVKTRVHALNGTIDVASTRGEGSTFTIRLPLTLAIINSLLVRVHDVVFSIPIDDVREIVAVQPAEVVTLRGRQTFAVRGEYLPLVRVENIFAWQEMSRVSPAPDQDEALRDTVILQVGKKTIGLQVSELLGSQDIVIKSLAENLAHIRGLSGASILGDGTVCLMLDVGAVLDIVLNSSEIAS
ncbi:MAG: chemotaxis protein CheA [Planctomycetota bacterium]